MQISQVLPHQTGENNFFMDLALCTHSHVETGKDLPLTVPTVGSTLLSKKTLYAVALKVQSRKP